MTKVLIRFGLGKPLDDAMMDRIADAHSIYGMIRILAHPESAEISVEYDASRLTPADVKASLLARGIAVLQK